MNDVPPDVGLGLGLGLVFIGLYLFIIVTVVAFTIWMWWRIFEKTGYGGWMGILMFVPIANFVLFIMLAFGKWPIERENEVLRAQAGGAQAGGGQLIT